MRLTAKMLFFVVVVVVITIVLVVANAEYDDYDPSNPAP